MFKYGRVLDFPSRQSLAREQDKVSEELRMKIQSVLGNVNFMSITIDLWSRSSNKSAFAGVTAHFYDKDDVL